MRLHLLLVLTLVVLTTSLSYAQTPQGRDLFNGKDLTGWRGRPHLSPYEEAAFDKELAAKKREEWNADRDLHWTVRDGELINDGNEQFQKITAAA
ncbi:MAG TPA: hypothetical protein PKA37_09885, partial [Planctomycetota bacterium]|nr:hypothetical protein [Planctomycetota bacterium]